MLKQGAWAAFHKNGVLDNYRLTEDAVIQGVECEDGDIILFDEKGRLTERVKKPSSAKEAKKSVT